MWTVYILRCADNSLYTGITTNLEKRLATHNCGKGAKYLRYRLPVSIAYSEVQDDRSHALKREYAIKRLSVAQKQELVRTFIAKAKSSIKETR